MTGPGRAGPRGVVEVLHPGASTLVQDRGRPGYAAIGVGRSGAADAGALRLANRLVGNDPSAAGLEVLLGGIELRFTAPTVLALAGAEVPAELDLPGSEPVPVGAQQAVRVPGGAVLRTGRAIRGLRLYLAVRGGVDVPPVLGSRASDQLSGLGPAPVRAGDELPVGRLGRDAAQPWPEPLRAWPGTAQAPGPAVLRVLPGPRPDWFVPDALADLSAAVYRVTPASNRVALRLDGPPVRRTDRGELPSEPLVPGAVQVPPDGRPVVFGADHPVTGGYPVLAVVLPSDLDLAAQLAPGAPVRLVPVGEPLVVLSARPGPSV
ncbi:MAG TPA: biotin-dependent carboxyltransferase family protein [Cellulomonas sp.]